MALRNPKTLRPPQPPRIKSRDLQGFRFAESLKSPSGRAVEAPLGDHGCSLPGRFLIHRPGLLPDTVGLEAC